MENKSVPILIFAFLVIVFSYLVTGCVIDDGEGESTTQSEIDGLTITIIGTGAGCPTFEPDPPSMAAGEYLRFYNQGSRSYTIYDGVTLDPWETDSGFMTALVGDCSDWLQINGAGTYTYRTVSGSLGIVPDCGPYAINVITS